MSERVTDGPPDELNELSSQAAKIVTEELEILSRVRARMAREAEGESEQLEDLDSQLLELRDAIAEAKEEDIPSLVDQMHQVAALSQKRGKGKSLPVDPENPYFGHLRLKEARAGRRRDVLIGKRTLLDDGDGLSIVDWRNAPVSRLYYRYEEEDDYEEEFDERSLEGTVLIRRAIGVARGELRRVDSPQGSYLRGRKGWREASAGGKPSLEGGVGTAVRVPRGRLGVLEEDDPRGTDKHLQEITALIDAEQFKLITQPDSGVVLIQGGAGSGKTTVALHRVAYLAFQDARRFSANRMIIVVFNEALVEYIRHVLPSLGVEGVHVTTYRRWSAQLLQRLKLDLPRKRTDSTPEAVSRFKKHRVILMMIDELIEVTMSEAQASLERRLKERDGAPQVLKRWRELGELPPIPRVQRMLDWVKRERGLAGKTRAATETVLRSLRSELRDIVADWTELFGDGERIRAAIREHAADDFNDTEVQTIVTWCTRKAGEMVEYQAREGEEQRRRADGEDDEDEVRAEPIRVELDGEDDAIILRLLQSKQGGIFLGSRRFEYEHIVIDEAQDLCPLEVRVLLDTASSGRSVTIAGDKAQKMIFDNGFKDWPTLLADAGLPHTAIQPLKITYRSTRQVMALARHVLGPLHDPNDDLVARDGACVAYHGFGDMGQSVAFLADALRGLMAREPSASVALITRFPQQAAAYYDALRVAEVPRVRLVARQDFSFTSGIDITDVRQVKGLEFDYVILLDTSSQNYPETTAARHLMHIAMTRSAYQLWLVNSGRPSALLPEQLVESGEI